MSTAKMVADSTVPSDLPSEGQRGRNSSERKRSKKQKKSISKEGTKNVTSEDSDSDLDLSKDLFSIGGYIKDRPEMIEQMFRAVRGPSLRRALPDILLHLSLDDLKQKCLEQLEIMSRKRILRILDGLTWDWSTTLSFDTSTFEITVIFQQKSLVLVTEDSSGEDMGGDDDAEPNSSASSEQDQAEEENIEDAEEANDSEDGSDEEEEYEEASEEGMDDEAEEEEEEEEMDQAESGGEGEGCIEEDEVVNEVEMVEAGGESPTSENCEEGAADESQCLAGSSEAKESPEPSMETFEEKSQRAPALTKEQMEILELEMRARAIKAMLNKHPKTLIPMLPSNNTKAVQKIGETGKYDLSQDVEGDTRTCKSSKAQKERSSKKKARIPSTCDASVQRKGKTAKRSKRKSADSYDSISLSQETPTCSHEPGDCNVEHDEDSNSTANADHLTVEVEPEDGEVAFEGEVNDDEENSNQAALAEKEESENTVDSSTVA
ncbi:caspase activity and apoptosis inhibitor 1-like [Liolophura sinensis]|uniref:caspase activity and apoptosis inhibitor 1-like n=1 Tax=Liolophura sinensis TaxID=3198878 RepID=UPI00315963F0